MFEAFRAEFEEYLRDESRKTGEAQFISFPKTEDEVREVIKSADNSGMTITIQGARTGITAGAVPCGGHILNMSRMNEIIGLRYDEELHEYFLTVQPGVLLTDIRKALADKPCFFPPDPTETSASIGGMVACNASGACSYYYGPTRKFIEALHVILPDGSGIQLRRGKQKATEHFYRLQTDTGRIVEGELPGYRMPAVKNASGYFTCDNMDIIDLFIGAEGTLGVVTEIELRLLRKPGSIWGVIAFFPSEENAVKFVRALRGEFAEDNDKNVCSRPAAIEYFNHNTLDLLRKMKSENPAFSEIPHMPFEYHTAIYIEYHGDDDDAVSDMVMVAVDHLVSCGGSDETSWIAINPRELEKLKYFRHAVPEAVNLDIDSRRKSNPGIAKLGTDMAVPDAELENIIGMYNHSLTDAGLDSVMFGHIGDNHIHVNILPGCMEDYNKGKKLYLEWACEVIRKGGTISAEHGVGKLKTELLREMYGEDGMEQMRSVKSLLDPDNIINRGNIFKDL